MYTSLLPQMLGWIKYTYQIVVRKQLLTAEERVAYEAEPPFLRLGIQWVPRILKIKESGDKPDSFCLYILTRLHDTEVTSCDTNCKEGKDDCD